MTVDLLALPFGLSIGAGAWMAASVFVAAYVRGYSGFGYSAIVIAASGLVTNPLNFVAVVVLLEAAMSLQAWKGAGRFIDWRRVGWLMAGAAIGLPLGLLALTAISEDRSIRGGWLLFKGIFPTPPVAERLSNSGPERARL